MLVKMRRGRATKTRGNSRRQKRKEAGRKWVALVTKRVAASRSPLASDLTFNTTNNAILEIRHSADVQEGTTSYTSLSNLIHPCFSTLILSGLLK